MATVTVTFKGGKANIDAAGFRGSSCVKATEFLKSLGKTTGDYEYKSSYYEEQLSVNGECHTDNLCG